MSDRIHTVIPTHGRAGRVSSHRLFIHPVLCVAESQAPLYKEHYPNVEIVVHPDSVKGLPPKLQWMYEHFGNLFHCDDDVDAFVKISFEPGEPTYPRLSPVETQDAIETAAQLCEDIGAYFFGFSNIAVCMYYNPMKPFSLGGYINGMSYGLLQGSKLYYSTRLMACGDFFISGLNAHFHRKAFIDTRYAFVQHETMNNPGGQGLYRDADSEGRTNRILTEYFGNAISVREGAIHKNQRSLHIPWKH